MFLSAVKARHDGFRTSLHRRIRTSLERLTACG